MKRVSGYFRLLRLPNILTAISDVLAGIAIGGSLVSLTIGRISNRHVPLGELLLKEGNLPALYPIFLIVLSTSCLYGGGVVLNDVFDAELDIKERPERPIPSGLIKKSSAALFGILLLLAGILTAALTVRGNLFSITTLLAVIIAIAAVIYDKWLKHSRFLGPLNMGVCRGCNLLLGMSIVSYSLQHYWYISIIPVMYIYAITMISRGEVHGGKKNTLRLALILYFIVILSILVFSFLNNTITYVMPFLIAFCFLILVPLYRAIKNPQGTLIGNAVKSGVIALIPMNAAWAAGFGDLYFAVLIIFLFPVSWLLARIFAVT